MTINPLQLRLSRQSRNAKALTRPRFHHCTIPLSRIFSTFCRGADATEGQTVTFEYAGYTITGDSNGSIVLDE